MRQKYAFFSVEELFRIYFILSKESLLSLYFNCLICSMLRDNFRAI